MDKKPARILALLAILFIQLVTLHKVSAQPREEVSLQVFYDQLAPYGQWVEDAQYGYVWVPDAEDDFRPYFTNGYWVMTDYGNTWMSGYPWGWAPFHYGRWIYNSYYGWVWIPGYEWGPAWVCWRYSGRFYGWAPLSPGFTVTIGFGVYDCPANWWVFIRHKRLYRHHYVYRPRTRIYRKTTIIRNVYTDPRTKINYMAGPTPGEIRNNTGRDVPVFRVEDTRSPNAQVAGNNSVGLYRPSVIKAGVAPKDTRPANVVPASRPITVPQPVNTSEYTRPLFKDNTAQRQQAPVQETVPARPPADRRPATPRIFQEQPRRQNEARPVQPAIPRQQPIETRPRTPANNMPVQQPQEVRPARPAERMPSREQLQPKPARPATTPGRSSGR